MRRVVSLIYFRRCRPEAGELDVIGDNSAGNCPFAQRLLDVGGHRPSPPPPAPLKRLSFSPRLAVSSPAFCLYVFISCFIYAFLSFFVFFLRDQCAFLFSQPSFLIHLVFVLSFLPPGLPSHSLCPFLFTLHTTPIPHRFPFLSHHALCLIHFDKGLSGMLVWRSARTEALGEGHRLVGQLPQEGGEPCRQHQVQVDAHSFCHIQAEGQYGALEGTLTCIENVKVPHRRCESVTQDRLNMSNLEHQSV
jgi:hypothetical protein